MLYHWESSDWTICRWRPTPAACYLSFLQKSLRHLLQKRIRLWYQRDGAPPDVSGQRTEYRHRHYPHCCTGFHVPRTWPTRTLDLTPIYYFLWAHMKNMGYRQIRRQKNYCSDWRPLTAHWERKANLWEGQQIVFERSIFVHTERRWSFWIVCV